MHHEVWADEAQVWQLCKHLSLSDLLNHLHNEGHPFLLYLLVMPFAKISYDIIWMKLLCWISAVFSIFILFYKSPFKIYTKFAILLSAGFIYFFPVLARSYSILPFLVFSAAILYLKQKEHPILYAIVISLIATTHAIMFFFACILLALFIYDNFYKNIKEKQSIKCFIPSLFIMLISFIYVIWQLHDTTQNSYYIKFHFNDLPLITAKTFSYFFVNAYNSSLLINFDFSYIDIALILLSIIIYVSLFIYLFLRSKRIFFIVFLSIAFQFFIYIFIYSVHTYVTRIFSAHIILLFGYWILLCEESLNTKNKFFIERVINISLTVFFILTSINGLNFYTKDILYNYSPGIETAKFIKENIKDDDIILSCNEIGYIILIYYLEKENHYNIFHVLRNKKVHYVKWDEFSYFKISNLGWKNYVEDLRDKNFKNNIYILVGSDNYDSENILLSEEFKDEFELIYDSRVKKSIVQNENNLIFKYKL